MGSTYQSAALVVSLDSSVRPTVVPRPYARRPTVTTALTGENANAPASTKDDIQLAQQLQAAEARLVDRYREHGEITEDRVRSTYAGVVSRFADAPVRNFLPILVERAVQHELER